MENELSNVCVLNDVLGKHIISIDPKRILDNKLACAIRNAQKANNALTQAFDDIFSKEDQEKLAETADILDEQFGKVLE